MRAKTIKVAGWTLGMAAGVCLITDGKGGTSEHPLQHFLIGAAIGLALGLIFARNLRTTRPTSAD